MVMPLLFVGVPQTFPPLDEEELAAAKQGVNPLFIFLESVPFQFKAPEEEGLLGAFPAAGLAMPHPGFKATGQLRLVKVPLDAVKEPLSKFDPAKTRDALKRFEAYLREKTGPVQTQGDAEAAQMFEAALLLLGDLKTVVESGHDVCVRRLTEAEAASEPALALVRQALSAPRIILAT
jgi:hypothetical protein